MEKNAENHSDKRVSSKSNVSHGPLCPRSGQSVATPKGSETRAKGHPGGQSRGQKVELQWEPRTAEQMLLSRGVFTAC